MIESYNKKLIERAIVVGRFDMGKCCSYDNENCYNEYGPLAKALEQKFFCICICYAWYQGGITDIRDPPNLTPDHGSRSFIRLSRPKRVA